jgi:hypothetical protein
VPNILRVSLHLGRLDGAFPLVEEWRVAHIWGAPEPALSAAEGSPSFGDLGCANRKCCTSSDMQILIVLAAVGGLVLLSFVAFRDRKTEGARGPSLLGTGEG